MLPISILVSAALAADITWYADSDGDGYGDPLDYTVADSSAAPAGYVTDSSDCDDDDSAVNPGGTETWMVDLDAQGRTQSWRQVLDWQHLQQVQGTLPGQSRDQVLALLGRPSEVRSGGWQGGEVWSWRHDSPFCLWLQASVGEDGKLRDAGFYPDPRCDVNDDHDR